MSLSPGTRLGPYEILSALGAGGMGEVYRARDTRLDRTVAVKVLPADLAADPDRRARFEREARAIAALSHPHICTIHDVGRHDGIDYLVMEYLEGETLADRLAHAKGPLPLEQVLTIGIAHRRCARQSAPRRHRASRSQTRQHHADEVRRASCSTSASPSCADQPRRSRCPP